MNDHELRIVALQGECDVAVNRLIEESGLPTAEQAAIRLRHIRAMVEAGGGDVNAILGLAALILKQMAKHQDDAPIVLLCSKTAQCLAEVNKRAFVAAAAGSGGEFAIAIRSRQRHCRCQEGGE